MSNLAITRVANACALLELNGHTILTDPWFTERWYLRRGEPLGLTVAELPALTAIVATSFAANHWDLRALREYPHKTSTPVYVSTSRMARQARTFGYRMAEVLPWNETRDLAPALSIEAVPAGKTMVWPNNAYVFTSGQTRIFFGGEIQDVALLESYRSRRAPVAVALLPVNGLRPLLGPPLVMGPKQAVAGTAALGAQVLVPIHEAHAKDPLSLIFRKHGSSEEARALATGFDVVCLPPGQRWEY
ncbi:L-ascorbate metabolism protein UlaG (beta-lactamase superfamily) [Kibdelosporangium banguiense]|uniref:L-ascorbate metabolism protein UlaG (Beta-lactamase superfamily) n=1 Tax=Kibdelosporangium banguiense TaxID=1365924 RepID=A0ABS4U0K6_9PSEU|nr:MBL fold metallo-hydrolase [Kibdelosporangium banguiense]MBP2329720.1 L-ascorbate metabolism protein UlaG (beta-lactamase superfamily) [Kibdelosporangium banguiense]